MHMSTTDGDGSDREFDIIHQNHHNADEVVGCFNDISTLSASEACGFSTDTPSTLTTDDPNKIYYCFTIEYSLLLST